MGDTRRHDRIETREMPRGNAPLLPSTYRLSPTAPPQTCGCGDRATELVFDPRGNYWSCGRSKCVTMYARER